MIATGLNRLVLLGELTVRSFSTIVHHSGKELRKFVHSSTLALSNGEAYQNTNKRAHAGEIKSCLVFVVSKEEVIVKGIDQMSIMSIMRSRSCRAWHERGSTAEVARKGNQEDQRSFWADMPQEMLREVFVRIEASESCWPPRKSVVACAGVCRSWRHIVKGLVKVPEISGKLTFPTSLKQPGPRDLLIRCFIRRYSSSQTYYLYLSLTNALTDDGKFLLAARKNRRPTCSDYIILLDADGMSKGSSNYVGKLRSNFLGTKFTVYDAQPPHAGVLVNSKQVSPRVPSGNYPVAHISYELNMLGASPRKMQCIMDAIPATVIGPGGICPMQTEFSLSNVDSFPSIPFSRTKSNHMEISQSGSIGGKKDRALVLENKAPRWHEQLQCWCLNFHGRVTVASVKNFQLVASPENASAGPEHEKIILQFGKIGEDLFTMDYRYPISAFQAFAICLSSFDTKIAYE